NLFPLWSEPCGALPDLSFYDLSLAHTQFIGCITGTDTGLLILQVFKISLQRHRDSSLNFEWGKRPESGPVRVESARARRSPYRWHPASARHLASPRARGARGSSSI